MRAPFVVLWFASAALLATNALADDKSECLGAASKGQSLRDAHSLLEAREQFRTCARQECPGMVRGDCTGWLDEVERALPSIVFDAKDPDGGDLSLVKVSVDGKPLVDRLDGSALVVNPGDHDFTFEVAGQAPVVRHFVLKEGEKERRERIVIGQASSPPPAVLPPAALPPSTAPAPSPEAPAPSTGWTSQKTLGVIVGGVGLAGVAVGSVFGLLTASAASRQKTECPSSTNCPQPSQAADDHSSGVTDGTVSTVSFIAGGALLVTGAVLFLTSHPAPDRPAAARLVVLPGVGPGAGGMLLRGSF